MGSTYSDLCVHVVFSTKDRRPWIDPPRKPRLHKYLGATLVGLGATPLAIGGVEDHVHLLIGTRTDQRASDLIRETKKASTAWARTELVMPDFAWQEGYAAFSVGSSERGVVRRYIENQEAHHQTRSSRDELRELLVEHGIAIDERYFV